MLANGYEINDKKQDLICKLYKCVKANVHYYSQKVAV